MGLGCGTVHPVAAGSLKHAFPHLLELVERMRRVRQHLELGHGGTVARGWLRSSGKALPASAGGMKFRDRSYRLKEAGWRSWGLGQTLVRRRGDVDSRYKMPSLGNCTLKEEISAGQCRQFEARMLASSKEGPDGPKAGETSIEEPPKEPNVGTSTPEGTPKERGGDPPPSQPLVSLSLSGQEGDPGFPVQLGTDANRGPNGRKLASQIASQQFLNTASSGEAAGATPQSGYFVPGVTTRSTPGLGRYGGWSPVYGNDAEPNRHGELNMFIRQLVEQFDHWREEQQGQQQRIDSHQSMLTAMERQQAIQQEQLAAMQQQLELHHQMMEQLMESVATLQSRCGGIDRTVSPLTSLLPRKAVPSEEDYYSSESEQDKVSWNRTQDILTKDMRKSRASTATAADAGFDEGLAQFLTLKEWPNQGLSKKYSTVAVRAGTDVEPLSDFGYANFSTLSKQFRKDKVSTLEWDLSIPLREFVNKTLRDQAKKFTPSAAWVIDLYAAAKDGDFSTEAVFDRISTMDDAPNNLLMVNYQLAVVAAHVVQAF